MMNSLPTKKRDPGAPMITSEIGGMTFTRSLLDTRASINHIHTLKSYSIVIM